MPSPAVAGGIYDVFVTVDGGNDARTSAIDECNEDNNETNWGEVLCY